MGRRALRRRTSDVTLKVSKPDGSTVELSATNVKGMTPEKLTELLQGAQA